MDIDSSSRVPAARALKSIDWDGWQPQDIATLTFVFDGSQVLLIEKKRGLGAGKVNAPGGRLEPGESITECAIREVREEVGIDIESVEPVGQLCFQFVDGYSLHVSVFRAFQFTGEAFETEEANPFWVDIEQIPYHRMWSDDVYWLPKVLGGTPFFGRFIFDGDEMLDMWLIEGNDALAHLSFC